MWNNIGSGFQDYIYPKEQGFSPTGVREVQHHSDGAHFSFKWLKQCILIATRMLKSFNVVFKHCSDQFGENT